MTAAPPDGGRVQITAVDLQRKMAKVPKDPSAAASEVEDRGKRFYADSMLGQGATDALSGAPAALQEPFAIERACHPEDEPCRRKGRVSGGNDGGGFPHFVAPRAEGVAENARQVQTRPAQQRPGAQYFFSSRMAVRTSATWGRIAFSSTGL